MPDMTSAAAKWAACCDDPHCLSIVTPGHALGQAGREPGGARDVERLGADLVDAAEDHVVDGGGVDAGALDERRQDVGAEIGRMHLRRGRRRACPPATAQPRRCTPLPASWCQAAYRRDGGGYDLAS